MADKVAPARVSATLPQQRPHSIRVLPAAPQVHAALDLDHVSARLVRPHREDAIHGYDRRSMNADEAIRVELILRLLHRAAPEVTPVSYTHLRAHETPE